MYVSECMACTLSFAKPNINAHSLVGAAVGLSHSNDGSVQGHISVMIRRVFANVSSKLCHLSIKGDNIICNK